MTSPGHSFSDVARKVVSIINLASVRAIENMVGAPVHPLRFRANLYVEGWPAWHEFDLLDRTLAIGDVRLKVVKRIVRCAAVNVDPDTAQRDLAIPQALQRRLGHADCGIYAEVIDGRHALAQAIRSRRSSRSCCKAGGVRPVGSTIVVSKVLCGKSGSLVVRDARKCALLTMRA